MTDLEAASAAEGVYTSLLHRLLKLAHLVLLNVSAQHLGSDELGQLHEGLVEERIGLLLLNHNVAFLTVDNLVIQVSFSPVTVGFALTLLKWHIFISNIIISTFTSEYKGRSSILGRSLHSNIAIEGALSEGGVPYDMIGC